MPNGFGVVKVSDLDPVLFAKLCQISYCYNQYAVQVAIGKLGLRFVTAVADRNVRRCFLPCSFVFKV